MSKKFTIKYLMQGPKSVSDVVLIADMLRQSGEPWTDQAFELREWWEPFVTIDCDYQTAERVAKALKKKDGLSHVAVAWADPTSEGGERMVEVYNS